MLANISSYLHYFTYMYVNLCCQPVLVLRELYIKPFRNGLSIREG